MSAVQGTFLNGGLARAISLEKNSVNEIWEQINFFKPHIILAHTIFDNKPYREQLFNILRKSRSRGCKVGYHAGDARGEPRYPHSIRDIVDFVLLNHWPHMPSYDVWQVPMYHWPYMALNQTDISKPDPLYINDLVFTGSLQNNQHHAPRAAFIEQLRSKVNVKTFPDPVVGNTRFQTPEVAASAGGVLGFQMGLDITGYQDVRPFQYIGAGALYFHDKHPSMDKFFEDGTHYISFERDNITDFYSKWQYYKENKEIAKKIRENGFYYCQEHHSSKSRVKQIINIVEGKPNSLYYLR